MKQAGGEESEDRPRLQSITITVASLIGSAVHGIIAYIAVYFFKPIWEKFMALLSNKSEK